MPDAYSFLLDAPTGEPRSRIQIAKLGSFKDPRYGDFKITAEQVKRWSTNLASLPGGRAPIDIDHSADKPGRNTEAAGWITSVALQDGVPTAQVEWTPLGEQAIRDRRYLFFSPTYGNHVDEKGDKHTDTLLGGALTNRPFLNMPTVSLAAAPFALEPEPAGTEPPADSRAAMPDLAPIAKALGLAEDAPEAKILEAVSAQPDVKALAAEQGLVLLSQADHDALKAQATDATKLSERVVALETSLADRDFEAAYQAALTDPQGPRVDAKPETRERLHKLYKLDAAAVIEDLESRPPLVSLAAQGHGRDREGYTGPGEIDGHQVDGDRAELLQKAEKYLAEHPNDNLTLEQAATAVLQEA